MFNVLRILFGTLFDNQRSNTPKTNPSRKYGGHRSTQVPGSIPDKGNPFFSFFLFLSPSPWCSMFQESSSVLYLTIRGQIHPKLVQDKHSRWRSPACDRSRVRALARTFFFSLFSCFFHPPSGVRCSRTPLRYFVS